MNKRGFDLLNEAVFDIFVIVIILSAGLFFISDNASGKMVIKQLVAKEICIFGNSMEENSELIIQTPLIVEKTDNEIIVKSSNIDYGYRYVCITSKNIQFEEINEGIRIIYSRE